MDSEKVGKFIRELRKKNNLTQADLAEKYGVTYQAVSKWENGINLPDISLLKEMSKDFNVNIEDILEGKQIDRRKDTKLYVIGTLIVVIILCIAIYFIVRVDNHIDNSNFEFKTITTTCSEFKVTGSIAYDQNKSSINIAKIDYCGGDDKVVYDTIECALYEEENDSKALISKCNKIGKNEKLEDYLKEVEVGVDNYKQMCTGFVHNDLYLEIRATSSNKTTIYKVDLKLNDNCPN